MKKFLFAILLASVMALPISAYAYSITEIEGNHSWDTAMDLTDYFSEGTNQDITNADIGWDWVSVSADGENAYDFFSVYLSIGDELAVDIDYSHSLDSELGVWSPTAQLIVWNDDIGSANQDTGSNTWMDSFGMFTAKTEGYHIIGVSAWPSSGDDNYTISGNTISSSSRYTLQLSTNADMISHRHAPEPTTCLLYGIGLMGFAGLSRRKKA